jgi:molybdopterin-synthase adenylyltransferase
MKNTQISLQIPPQMWQQIRQAMLANRTNNEETTAVDDRAESEYAKFLSHRSDDRSRLISGVFDESLERGQFRIWNRKGTDFRSIAGNRSWLEIDEIELPETPTDPIFARQQVFGTGCQQQLNQLTVALVGCGGIGAIFAETLGRLGVKNWILTDQ